MSGLGRTSKKTREIIEIISSFKGIENRIRNSILLIRSEFTLAVNKR